MHAARQLGDAHGDAAALGRELDRVAHDVHEDLLQAREVADDVLVLDVDDVDAQVEVLGDDLGVDDGQELFDGVGKLELLVCEPDGARFNLGHVEDLVDEAEQVMARRGDVGEAFAHALGVVGMHARDGREAHDGVHGRAYVMAHGIEEVALGL